MALNNCITDTMRYSVRCAGLLFCIGFESNGNRDCADRDDSVVQALKELGTERGLRSNEWQEKDGLVLYRGKIYVPRDSQLQLNIVKAHHDYPIAGHPGQWKTTELVSCNFWWPQIGRYVADYVRGCDLCNRTKTFPTSPTGKLMPNQVPNHCWKLSRSI